MAAIVMASATPYFNSGWSGQIQTLGSWLQLRVGGTDRVGGIDWVGGIGGRGGLHRVLLVGLQTLFGQLSGIQDG